MIKQLLNNFKGEIYRFFKYKSCYFFDTNMVVSNSKSDKRLTRLFTINKKYFLAENIEKEVTTLLKKTNYRKILRTHTNSISFEDLRDVTPEMCPLYYNFISYMNSPASVLDPHFFISQISDALLKKKPLTPEEVRMKNVVIDDLIRFEKEKAEELKREGLSDITALNDAKYYKKKRKNLKNGDQNYMNDMKNVALALLYCLIYRQNVTIVTADADYAHHFFELTGAVADHWALKTTVLSILSEKKKINILSKKPYTFFIKPQEHARKRMEILSDFYSNHWKRGFAFKIKIWDQKNKKYEELNIIFNEEIRNLFLNATGNFKCPYAQNNTMGSWLNVRYFWPPKNGNFKKMRVSVSKENMVVYKNKYVPREIHETSCLYSQKDQERDYTFFSSFVEIE